MVGSARTMPTAESQERSNCRDQLVQLREDSTSGALQEPTSPTSPSMGDVMRFSSAQLIGNAVDTTKWLMTQGTQQDFWHHHCKDLEENGSTDVFHQNDSMLAKDSGFSDVRKMMYPYKYFAALLALVSLFSNMYTIVSEDWAILLERSSDADESFLLTSSVAKAAFGFQDADKLHKLVPALELACLVFCLLRLLRLLVTAAFYPLCCRGGTPEEEEKANFVRWDSLASAFWSHLPWAATFSAMKMLYYVTPIVLSTQAYNLGIFITEKLKEPGAREGADGNETLRTGTERCFDKGIAFSQIVWFLSSRIVCLIVGIDAFLVKFRMTEKYADADSASAQTVLYCVVFLFQVLSIVNINRFVRDRLFLFLFAGEDGILNLQESARKDVWCALLARQMWKEYGCLNFFVLLLSFDDYDYQFLVLDPSKKDLNNNQNANSNYALLKPDKAE